MFGLYNFWGLIEWVPFKAAFSIHEAELLATKK
jgi:hypothetical protein